MSDGISGEAFTLGTGGIAMNVALNPEALFTIANPITLAASQTWTVSGTNQLSPQLEVSGALSGLTSNLTIDIENTGGVWLDEVYGLAKPNDEIGNVEINGTEEPGQEPGVTYRSSVLLGAGKFNSEDGHTLTLRHVESQNNAETGPIHLDHSLLLIEGSGTGPLTATSGSQLWPEAVSHLPSLSVDGTSELQLRVFPSNTALAQDNSQLQVSSSANLGGSLVLRTFGVSSPYIECPARPAGEVITLVEAGTLIGNFGNALNGEIINQTCYAYRGFGEHAEVLSERLYAYRINYNTSTFPETVTATAVATGPTPGNPPTISGIATQGQPLTEAHGSWENSASNYTYQWQRCDSSGNGCGAIGGATGQTYVLTSGDVGDTIRVQEVASNGEGTGTQVSAATAVVNASGSSSGTSGGGGGSGGGTSGGSSGSGGGTTAAISSAQITTHLLQQLVPSATAIGTLLKHGGLAMSFKALEAGTLAVGWYLVPPGAKLAKAKAVLVASGRLSFTAAGKATVKLKLTTSGKKLLKHASRLRLTAKATFTPEGKTAVSTTKSFTLKRK